MTTEVRDFEAEVISRSYEKPVLVGFWAPWCGPCKMLGPVLEKMADEEGARWELAKLNTDENQDIAQKFGIMSIPAVKLFSEGQVVDEFVGALPEALVRTWLDKALPGENQRTLDMAKRALDQDSEMAGHFLDNVLSKDPDNVDAIVLKAQLVALEDPAGAEASIQDLDIKDADIYQRAEAIRVVSHLSTIDDSLGDEAGAAQYLEAARLVGALDIEGALAKLVESVRLNVELDQQRPRRACIAIFTILGETNPLTRQYRRALERALF